jgi:hypothetical protein
MNEVANKGRWVAEYFVKGVLTLPSKPTLNEYIAAVVTNTVVTTATVAHLRTLQTLGNKGAHPDVPGTPASASSFKPADKPRVAAAVYEVALKVEQMLFGVPVPVGGGAAAGGLIAKIQAIRTALNITTPAVEMLTVLNEANVKLGRPAWSSAAGGTLQAQIAEVCAILGV